MKRLLISAFLLSLLAISGCQQSGAPSGDGPTVDALGTANAAKYDELKATHAGKVILMNFFASWCPPCRAETPGFISAYEDMKDDGFTIIGLSTDQKPADAVDFVNEMGVTYEVYLAEPALSQKYGINTIPTSILYRPDGSLYKVYVGYIDESDLKRTVKMLLEEHEKAGATGG